MNVIPIRPTVPSGPVFRTDTINTLWSADRFPVRGDMVRQIVLQDDGDGAVVVTTAAFGSIRDTEIHTDTEHPSLTLHFDFGARVTLSGTATLTWAALQ